MLAVSHLTGFNQQLVKNFTRDGTQLTNFTSNPGNAFDNAWTNQAGHNNFTTGYIGRSFSGFQRRVSHLVAVSNTSGFNGNAAVGNVTLSLYGKTGAAPSSNTNGTLLGQTVEPDQNVQHLRTVPSSDPDTLWDHVWLAIVIADGFSVTLTEVEFWGVN
jgi:hypothetical protein